MLLPNALVLGVTQNIVRDIVKATRKSKEKRKKEVLEGTDASELILSSPKKESGTLLSLPSKVESKVSPVVPTPSISSPEVTTAPASPTKAVSPISDTVPKAPSLDAPTLPKIKGSVGENLSELIPGIGSGIKKNVEAIVRSRLPDTPVSANGLFDGIDDKTVEKSIPLAEDTIKRNLESGALGDDAADRYPNLLSGLTMFYAASEMGKREAARRAREVAYGTATEDAKSTFLASNAGQESQYKSFFEDHEDRAKKRNTIPSSKKLPDFLKEIEISTQPDDPLKAFQSKDPNPTISELIHSDAKINRIMEERNVTKNHAKVIYYSSKWDNVPEYAWTIGDALHYKKTKDAVFLHNKKISFISNYRDVIRDAAQKFDIPPLLLAGVAYVEFGGDHWLLDDAGYLSRKHELNKLIDRINDFSSSYGVPVTEDVKNALDYFKQVSSIDSKYTSFGNTSIQVRRALEMLGYDDTDNNRKQVIKSLKNHIQSIYMTAMHLSDLRDIDCRGKSAEELTEDEIKIIASRYNIGPEPPKEAIVTEYGDRIYLNEDDILTALGLN